MKLSEVRDLARKYQDYMVEMRREFHRHPELSGEEFHTRDVLVREIESMGIPYKLLPGTGIIAIIQGGKPGKHRVIRADIDGLPVKEETNCGINTMLEMLKEYPIDECFALHVYSGLDASKVNIVPGPRMAGTVGIGFHVKGKAGHGSRPDQAANPIVPAAHIVTQIDSAFLNQIDAEETVTLGLCVFQAGETTNVIPEDAYVAGTARYFNKGEGEKALRIINMVAENTAVCHKCTVEFAERNKISLLPVVNDREVALRVQKMTGEICGEDVLSDCDRWYASECYSMYLENYPGALGFLGIRNEEYGSGAAHHNGKFDMDESALSLGVCAEVGFVLSK